MFVYMLQPAIPYSTIQSFLLHVLWYVILYVVGTIMLMDNEGEKIYDIKVDHQLFGLTKLDITVSSRANLWCPSSWFHFDWKQ